mgnify:CR=1 FL=1
MASRKNLKKEINDLCYEVVSDCFTYHLVHEDANRDKVMKIITGAIELRNELIARMGHPEDPGDPQAVKRHYSGIRNDLHRGMDDWFRKLSALSAK